MVYSPPTGVRDLLPLDVTQKRWIEDRLEQVFRLWGYHCIITSTLERLDTLMAGGAIARSTVIPVQAEDEGEVGLRPELTASIARAAVTRLAQAQAPLRLYYLANVFRKGQQAGRSQARELHQAGVELLGAGSMLADAEIVLLAQDCLAVLGLAGAIQPSPERTTTLILGEAALTRSLLAVFGERERPAVRQAIAQLDRLALEQLPLSPELHQRALMLLDLRGTPDLVLERLGTLDLSPGQQESVNRLKDLIETLSPTLAAQGCPLILDLSLVQTFDYYTGITLELVCTTPQSQRVLGKGGRYDQLLGLYHPQGQATSGIGFSLDLAELQQALLEMGALPDRATLSDWLVVPETAAAVGAAFHHAQSLRALEGSPIVEVYLGSDRSTALVEQFARQRQIRQLAWVRPDQPPRLEIL